MLIRFKSPATADVLMLGESAQQILRLVGKDGQLTGIFEVDDQPRLVELLDAAVAAEARALTEQAAADSGAKAPPRPSVSLRQRVWPLREMLLQSHRARVAVVWGV